MALSPVWNAPNLITLTRLLLAPFVVREILASHPRQALLLLAVAAFTDLLDGAIARATRGITRWGELMDPLADKVLLSGIFAGLAWIGTVPLWFVMIVFGRDFLLLLASLFVLALTTYQNLQPSSIGKSSTVFQIATAALLLAANATESSVLRTAGAVLLWPSALLASLSGIQYTWRWMRAPRNR